MSDELKLFQDDLVEDSLTIIDVDAINDLASNDAKLMVDNLSQFYYDEEFMKAHPQIRKRINEELETMRILIKMRKADEEAHDALVKAISANNNNASLYKALTQIQTSILSITTKLYLVNAQFPLIVIVLALSSIVNPQLYTKLSHIFL